MGSSLSVKQRSQSVLRGLWRQSRERFVKQIKDFLSCPLISMYNRKTQPRKPFRMITTTLSPRRQLQDNPCEISQDYLG